MRLLLAGVIALGVVVCIVSVLYLMGPETKCDVPEGLLCLKPKPTNAWERISGAITGD